MSASEVGFVYTFERRGAGGGGIVWLSIAMESWRLVVLAVVGCNTSASCDCESRVWEGTSSGWSRKSSSSSPSRSSIALKKACCLGFSAARRQCTSLDKANMSDSPIFPIFSSASKAFLIFAKSRCLAARRRAAASSSSSESQRSPRSAPLFRRRPPLAISL